MRLEQLDDAHLRRVTTTGARLGNAGIAAVAVGILRGDLVEQLLDDGFLRDETKGKTSIVKIIFLRNGDELFGQRADLFGAGDGGLNLPLFQQEGHHRPKHRHAVGGGSAELSGTWHSNHSFTEVVGLCVRNDCYSSSD